MSSETRNMLVQQSASFGVTYYLMMERDGATQRGAKIGYSVLLGVTSFLAPIVSLVEAVARLVIAGVCALFNRTLAKEFLHSAIFSMISIPLFYEIFARNFCQERVLVPVNPMGPPPTLVMLECMQSKCGCLQSLLPSQTH